MLMVSMNVMAQRETLTFNGIMANFPHGGSAETVLTIKPDGKYVFDVKKSKTVEPFTISGQMPVPMSICPAKTASGDRRLKVLTGCSLCLILR